jgi:hypothetical protein
MILNCLFVFILYASILNYKGGAVYTEYGTTYWHHVEFLNNVAGQFMYYSLGVRIVLKNFRLFDL